MSIQYADDEIVSIKELTALYEAVGWLLYASDPDRLALAIDRSTYVVTARNDEGELIGLIRCLSDDVAVLYLQEVVIHPDHHRQGIASRLIATCLDRFSHVPQKVLLVDDEASDQQLAVSMGFAPSEEAKLHAYVKTYPQLT